MAGLADRAGLKESKLTKAQLEFRTFMRLPAVPWSKMTKGQKATTVGRLGLMAANPYAGVAAGLGLFGMAFGRMIGKQVSESWSAHRSIFDRHGVNPITGFGGNRAGLLADPAFQAMVEARNQQRAEFEAHGDHIPDPLRRRGDPSQGAPPPTTPIPEPEPEDPEAGIGRALRRPWGSYGPAPLGPPSRAWLEGVYAANERIGVSRPPPRSVAPRARGLRIRLPGSSEGNRWRDQDIGRGRLV